VVIDLIQLFPENFSGWSAGGRLTKDVIR
jgi:hypothetical protein